MTALWSLTNWNCGHYIGIYFKVKSIVGSARYETLRLVLIKMIEVFSCFSWSIIFMNINKWQCRQRRAEWDILISNSVKNQKGNFIAIKQTEVLIQPSSARTALGLREDALHTPLQDRKQDLGLDRTCRRWQYNKIHILLKDILKWNQFPKKHICKTMPIQVNKNCPKIFSKSTYSHNFCGNLMNTDASTSLSPDKTRP